MHIETTNGSKSFNIVLYAPNSFGQFIEPITQLTQRVVFIEIIIVKSKAIPIFYIANGLRFEQTEVFLMDVESQRAKLFLEF